MADNNNSITAAQASRGLTFLPINCQVAIFQELDPLSSLALGLTCPKMYKIHMQVTGIITVDTFFTSDNYDAWYEFRNILDLWFGRNWVFNAIVWKYERVEETGPGAFFWIDLEGLYYSNEDLVTLLE